MTLWPKNERRTLRMTLGTMLFSGGVFSWYQAEEITVPLHRGLPLDIWPWVTTALFFIVVLLMVIGLLVMKREFTVIGERFDHMEENIGKLFDLGNRNANRITKMEVLCGTRHQED